MVEIRYSGREWTWANNRIGEGFVEERFDRFFASPDWIYNYSNAVGQHVQKQASDHCLLRLEMQPSSQMIKKRFYFDQRMFS